MSTTQGLAFHVHHMKLVEWCYNLDERVQYIRDCKPAEEVPTRLRLLAMVKGPLSPALQKALERGNAMRVKGNAMRDKGHAMWVKGSAMRVKGYAMLAKGQVMWAKGQAMWREGLDMRYKGYAMIDAAIAAHMPELERLHALECRACPWDGTAIFPRGGTR